MGIALMMLAASVAVFGQSAIYHFKGGADGNWPMATMVADAAGNLYGTTYEGGGSTKCGGAKNYPFGCGIVFELTPPASRTGPWTETVLYRFTDGLDGALPSGGVTLDQAGNLYGTTSWGGTLGDGTIYQLVPPATQGGSWTEYTIYNFSVSQNGYDFPYYLAVDKSGNLYGYGGATYGGVFQLAPPVAQGGGWTYNLLYSFQGGSTDGSFPLGGPVLDAEGNIYGATDDGGNPACGSGCGVIFKLEPPATQGGAWTEKVLYSFKGMPDGNYPLDSLMIGANGNLYGTTSRGGQYGATYGGYGTVFELAKPGQSGGAWTETVLYSFQDDGDGGGPTGGVVHDNAGNLYGRDSSTVFRISPPSAQGGIWTETTLYNLANLQGLGEDDAGLTLRPKSGTLYGTTQGGGICTQRECLGTVFSVEP